MILHNRFQNKVAGSRATLPLCACMSLAMWFLPWQGFDMYVALGWIACMLTVYFTMETNATTHLIRIRTRLTSCLWIVLASFLPFMHPLDKPMLCAVCLAASHYLLFKCYQLRDSQALIYHCFLCLGIGSFCTPIMIAMGVLHCLCLYIFLRAMTWKGFWAALLGFITPHWVWVAWHLLTSQAGSLLPWYRTSLSSIVLIPFGFSQIPRSWMLSTVFIAFLTTVAIVHYMRNNYNDKIKVRMILYIYVFQCLSLCLMLALVPTEYPTLMAMLMVCASPLLAHYFSLTGSIFSNTLFIVSIVTYIILAYYNSWTPSSTF